MRFAEGDPALDHLGRAGDHEQGVAILLDLRPLVGLAGVLDRERVQVELRLHLGQQDVIRFEQPDPHHVPRPPRPGACVFDRDVGHATAARIDAGRDDPAAHDCARRRVVHRKRRVHGHGDARLRALLSTAPTATRARPVRRPVRRRGRAREAAL
jgi:hypothetical protein